MAKFRTFHVKLITACGASQTICVMKLDSTITMPIKFSSRLALPDIPGRGVGTTWGKRTFALHDRCRGDGFIDAEYREIP